MNLNDQIMPVWWPLEDSMANQNTEHGSGRASTYTFNTIYTSHSDTCTSTSSDSLRFSRAPSLASTCTTCSSSSQPATISWISAPSEGYRPVCVLERQLASSRQTLKEKQAANPYACSHCALTFSKKSDRKKHILKSCPFLGGGLLCDQCLHISRNEHQAEKHQKEYRHKPSTEAVALSKHALTCSNDGKLYRSLEEYVEHFQSSKCILNVFDGNRKHHSRLRTLLSEGRDDVKGHSYIYAALIRYCSQKVLTMDLCNLVIDALPSSVAQGFAERLEWGCAPKDNSAHSRLGYTSFDDMVAEIMIAGIDDGFKNLSKQHFNTSSGKCTALKDPMSCGQEQGSEGGKKVPISYDTLDVASTRSSIRIRRKQIPIDPINASRQLPRIPAAEHPRPSHHKSILQPYRESPAVVAATQMLRQHIIHPCHNLDYYEPTGYQAITTMQRQQDYREREKRPRSITVDSHGYLPSSPPRSRLDSRPSPTRDHSTQSHTLQSRFAGQQGASDNSPGDWPEFLSLTPSPPHTAKLHKSTADERFDDGIVEEDTDSGSVFADLMRSRPQHLHKERRQGGVWDSWFEEFVSVDEQ